MNFDKERILVTGGSGFLGKELVKRLLPGWYRLGRPEWDLASPWVYSYQRRRVAKFNPEVVVHLAAACGGIESNQVQPQAMFHDNTQMMLEVVHLCQQHKARLIPIGTTCSYPDTPPNYPFKEEDFWAGYPHESNAPYGIAKKALWTYAKACNIRFVYPILTNLYGPGFRDDHVIPDLIRKFVEAKREGTKKVVLWGDGTPERDFLYVSDAADALIFLATHAPDEWWQGELVNIGSGISLQIHEVARIVRVLVDCPAEIVWDKSRPNGQMRRRLDISKMRSLGWKAKKAFLPGLKETVEWYLSQESDNDG